MQVEAIVDGTRRTFSYTNLERLQQLFDVEKEEMRLVERVEAGHGEIGELLIVRHSASVAERVVAIDEAQRVAVDEREDGYDQLEISM